MTTVLLAVHDNLPAIAKMLIFRLSASDFFTASVYMDLLCVDKHAHKHASAKHNIAYEYMSMGIWEH